MTARALTERMASACEYATTPRCRCRCGGAFHGAARGVPVVKLPPEDPHHARPSPAELQLSLLESLDESDTLARLEGIGPRPPEEW